MRRAFISWDLPVAPAEGAFTSAAAEFNAALAQLAPSAHGTANLFLVLREVRGTSPKTVQVSYDAEHNTVGIDCPLQVHVFEPNTQSVVASLAATLTAAINTAEAYCSRNSVSFNAAEIVQVIASVALAHNARSDA
jgi:hypothetical protein